MSSEPAIDNRDAEITDLRARVADLEAQLGEQARATNELVARAQQKLYWLERWDIDLDRVMRKPGALRSLEALRWLRAAIRKARKVARRAVGKGS